VLQPVGQRAFDVEAQAVELAFAAEDLGLAAASSAMRLPAFGDLLAPTCASASLPGSRRSTRISTRPPLSLRPCRRAGITRVSLNTSRSPGCRRPGRSAMPRSANGAGAGGTTSMRLAERSGSGACAISPAGNS